MSDRSADGDIDDGRLPPAVTASLLWGVVGGLAFLVLAQGYALLGVGRIDVAVMVGVAVAVGLAATVLTYVARQYLLRL